MTNPNNRPPWVIEAHRLLNDVDVSKFAEPYGGEEAEQFIYTLAEDATDRATIETIILLAIKGQHYERSEIQQPEPIMWAGDPNWTADEMTCGPDITLPRWKSWLIQLILGKKPTA